ncbi:MAG: Cysteine desulfurase IscS [Chlamydiae bacterium]|nr:Cysteine desulfurase IscS [Chlamydiota bacterium]
MTKIYLDNSMTTAPSEKAISGMMPYLTEMWGSPSAPHQCGQQLYLVMKESYQSLYDLLGANESDTIIFTSSGAEAVNHAIQSTYYTTTLTTGKNHFLTSSLDEAPAIMSIERLEEMGCVGKMVEVNKEGYITAEAIGDAITPRTAMVSLSWANGLTGVIQPVSEIASLCKSRGIIFHLDATHILGKLYFDLEDVGADFISFNGDHFHAPKGTGGLYIKNGTKCVPLISGGMEQGGYRGAPINIPGLVSLGIAAKEAQDSCDLLCTEVARFRDKLETGILEGFPEAVPFFRDQDRLSHCTTIAFPGIANEALLFQLDRKGVYASIGGGSFQQIGLLLIASGIEENLVHCAISFSLSRKTTEDEIDQAIQIIVESAKQLSKTSEKLV